MIETDDEIYRVDDRYLGPPGQTLPVQLRYIDWIVGVGVLIVLLVILRGFLQLQTSSTFFILLLAATIFLTRKLMKLITPERGVVAIFKESWNDLTAPRPVKPGEPLHPRFRSPTRKTASSPEEYAHE